MNHTDARSAATCPTSETLAAFLAASATLPAVLAGDAPAAMLSDAEKRALNDHVTACDRCLEELRAASYRLALADEIAAPVPAQVAARAAADPRPHLRPTAVESAGPLAAVRDWLAATIRMPVLVPVALAAMALIVVVPQLRTNTTDGELSRAVELRQIARVTADTAVVRTERDGSSPALGTLARGDRAVLVGERDGWYRIALADGSEGWIERSAFD